MNIFLDTADSVKIAAWKATGIVDGVTTNPTHLSAVGGDPVKTIKEICALLPQGVISVEVTESEPEAVYAQAKQIAALAKNVVVKIPCHEKYYGVIARLAAERIPLNITLVFSLVQGLMMCKLGVVYISPFVGRLDDRNLDGMQLVHDLRHMINQYGFETDILAASIRSVEKFNEAIMAGADAITLPPEVLKQAVSHELTDQGMAKFDADWKKLGITKFPYY